MHVFSGKLFKASDLNLVVEFFLMFHMEKPIDWLLDHILYVKVCNPEKDPVSTYIFTAPSIDRVGLDYINDYIPK